MRFMILGPLSVTDAAVTAGRDRIVLAALLLGAGRVVPVSELIDAVWDDGPPATARNQLQTCVSRLRRLLPAQTIQSDPAGYRLRVLPGELDASLFTSLVADGRVAGDAAILRRALGLWRGDALQGIESLPVRRQATVLDEQRLAVAEEWAGLELAAGRHDDLVGELTTLVERHPLRERLRAHLMTALHRSGRTADALAEYRRAAAILRDELGIDPGSELQALHSALLGDRQPALADRATPDRTTAVRCLPRTVSDFTGRRRVVRDLVAVIEAGGPVVVAVDGMAGSGKTTLALHVATLVGDRFPDAHLHVDLHGHSVEQPLDQPTALLILLRQLGVPADTIPPALVDRLGVWRTELSRRRTLVLFDNAASSAQVRDLLPTAPDSLALVTSRRRLSGLDGARSEALGLLDAGEAVELFARIVGDRVDAEPAVTAEVMRRCGGLPLAIRLAGGRLRHRPQWQVADLLSRLGDTALPELAAEDRTVAEAFALSFRHLSSADRRTFRLLGVHPGADFDALGVAALTGLPVAEAADALDDLVDVHLVEEPQPGVYRLHDLLREYATALAVQAGPAERREALRQLLDQQMHAAAATTPPAARTVIDRDLRHPVPLRPDLLAALSDPAARFERERKNLAGYVRGAVEGGFAGLVWQIPRAAWRPLWFGGYLDDVERLHTVALAAVEPTGDRSAIATLLNYLASAYFPRGRISEAIALMRRCVQLREEDGDPRSAAIALGNVAGLFIVQSRWSEALDTCRRAKAMSPPQRDITAEDNMFHSRAANAYAGLRRYPEAVHHQRQRLFAALALGDARLAADALVCAVSHKYQAGLLGTARGLRQMRVAMTAARRCNFRASEAEACNEMARMLRDGGRLDEALTEHQRAMELSGRIQDNLRLARHECETARTMRLAGDVAGADGLYRAAVRRATDLHDPYLIALARTGLGECLAATDASDARRLWEQALATFTDLGTPEADDVRALLAGPPSGADDERAAKR